MRIDLHRFKFTDNSTLGQLIIDGDPLMYSEKYDKFLPCYILEDKDRGLFSYMKESEILSVKVNRETAIPYGKYKVIIDYSNRFKCDMPHIVGVKGFSGVRMHVGNYIGNTEGCLIGGYEWKILVNENNYMVTKSKDWFADFFSLLKYRISKGEEVTLEISK